MRTNSLFILSFLFLFFYGNISKVNGQYYYKDILGTAKDNKEFSILKNANIKDIKITSFDENDQPSKGFFCEKKINKNFSQSKLLTNSNITGQSLLVTDYNDNGQVIRTTTTTPYSTNVVEYKYDTAGRIVSINTRTSASDDTNGISETHEYFYENGKPVKMVRKKNNQVISTITFKVDNKGNIIEEDPSGKSNDKKYYYYYDDNNRLTDVVHFNVIAKKLLPDYMFEYDDANHKPKQMISVDETGRNYFIWRYAYDDRKLPEIQKCYSKEKQLLGTIQYDYLQ
jgi:YD repeat-containing protein